MLKHKEISLEKQKELKTYLDTEIAKKRNINTNDAFPESVPAMKQKLIMERERS
jgi:hypothetical protein